MNSVQMVSVCCLINVQRSMPFTSLGSHREYVTLVFVSIGKELLSHSLQVMPAKIYLF